jgi:hypothetical protein
MLVRHGRVAPSAARAVVAMVGHPGGAAVDIMMSERVAWHDDAMWREEFPLMIAWASDIMRGQATCT